MGSWKSVSSLEDGQNVEAATFNKPLSELSSRTTYLKEMVDAIGGDETKASLRFTVNLSEDGRLLWQVADTGTGTLIYRIVGNLLIVQIDVTGIGNDQTCCHIERSSLAGTIRSQQSHYLTLTHIDAHAIGYGTFAVYLDQSFRSKHHSVCLFDVFFFH